MSASAKKQTVALDQSIQDIEMIPLFKGLDPKLLNEISTVSDLRDYAGGEYIYSSGQFDASEFIIVLSGRLKSTQSNSQNGSLLVFSYFENDIFGLDSVFAAKALNQYSFSLCAETEAKVLGIDGDAFREILNAHPALMQKIIGYFAQSLMTVKDTFLEPEATNEKRIYMSLNDLVEFDGERKKWCIPNLPKHREIALNSGAEDALVAEVIAKLIADGVAHREYPGLIFADIERFRSIFE